jgi:molybdate transport system substrate-binding protein
MWSALGAKVRPAKLAVAMLTGAVSSGSVMAGEVQVAVAANFATAFQQIASDFAAHTGHKAVAISGATGKFHVQIQQGAPFEVLLSADDETPRKLLNEGLAVKGSSFTYAIGKLVLWSAKPGIVDAKGAVLRRGTFAHLALANPRLAPYGVAALEALKALGAYEAVKDRVVLGENIAQAYQFVATGNAELGFVALSQAAPPGKPLKGSYWLVPQTLYQPLLQDAVLLNPGANNAAAKALLAYLRSDAAKALIQSYGYGF